MENWIADGLLPAAMIALMFGMGLTLTIEDFRRIAAAPKATILGTGLQLVGMPLAGIGLALAYELPPLLAAGLVVVAACPGGMFSNMFVHMGRANTALSITLTATATMVTLFTLPLWVQLMLASGGQESIEIPVLDSALQLGALTVLPVVCGMLVRSHRPDAARIERWLTRGSALVIAVGMTYDGSQQPELPIAEFRQSLAPALWLIGAAIVSGVAVPKLLRLPTPDTVTLAVELVVKNILLGLVLVRQSLDFEATVPILAFGSIQTPAGVVVLVAWRFLARSGWVEGPSTRGQPWAP